MTLTHTALEREMILVPTPPTPTTGAPDSPRIPDGSVGLDSSDHSEQARRLQAEFDATGRLSRSGHRPPSGKVIGTRKWALVMRAALLVLAVVSIGMVVQLAYVSRLEHRSAQVNLYNQFRTELAQGTGPLGPRGIHHSTLALGAPMAQITIPSIGVSQVVLEGTTGNILADGPGHMRSTVFPGGTGDSIILGRAAAYGGPFGRISHLRKGAKITVVTQVGTSVFRVIDVRPSGAKVIKVPGNSSVLTLGTASGTPFAPSGVVFVDALKIGEPVAAQNPLVKTVPASEQPLGFDTGDLWALSLCVLGLAALAGGAIWTWKKRGHAQAWIVFTAPMLLVWMFVADQFARLLPNLL
jgi:LPXTG-site transpeptidase (sortase) family protein